MQVYYENHRDDMAHAYAWYTNDDHCTPHFHNSVELVYVLDGELYATLNGVTHVVSRDNMLINSSYTIHSYATPKSSCSIIGIIPMAEVPTVRTQLTKQAFASSVCPDDEKGTLRTLMEMMVMFRSGHALSMKGLSYTVLGYLIDHVGLTEARANSRTAFIRGVLDYLQQHHTEPLSAEQVAEHFGYSRSRFSHLFNEHLGYTLSEYIGALRCHHAVQLLRETDLPVSDVAMAVGFESLRTFYRTFKKQYEMTPNRFARV